MIQIRRIYEPPGDNEGHMVFIDRLWPRGLKKEQVRFDVWLKDLAPSTELRKWFGHDPAKWEEFKSRYFHELEEHPRAIADLVAEASAGTVTLLFGAKAARFSNATALKEYLEERLEQSPSFKVTPEIG